MYLILDAGLVYKQAASRMHYDVSYNSLFN